MLIILMWAVIGFKAHSQTNNKPIPNSYDTAYVLKLYDSAYINLISYDAAMNLVAKALEISKSLDYGRGIAISYFYKGSAHLTHDMQKDAISNFDTALVLLKRLKLHNDVVVTYRNIGNSYYFLSDYKTALHYSKKGLLLSDSIDNKLESARLKSQLGSCYEDMGKYKKSLELLLEANRDYNLLNDQEGIAESLNSIGVIYNALGQFEKANYNFNKAMQIYEDMGDDYGISNCLINIGNVCFYNNETDSALLYFQKSLQIDSIRNDTYGICLCLANIGQVYSSKGDYAEAKEYFSKSLKISKEINNITMVSGINYQLASLNMKLGNYSKAILYGNESLVLARQTGNPQDIINACKLLAELYAQEGKYKKANECLSEILKLNDSVFSIKKNQEVFLIESKYEAEKQKFEIQSLKQVNERQAQSKRDLVFTIIIGTFLVLVLFHNIFHTRKSRTRIRIQKKYFETLLTNSEDFVIVVDKNANLKYVSPSYEKLTGRKIEDRIGNNSLEFIHPDDKGLLQKHLKKSLETKEPISFEFRANYALGELRYMSAYAKNLLDDPDIKGIVINILGITERKNQEKIILKKQKEIEQSQKLAKLGGWKININTGIITLSKEVMTLFGEKEEEINLFFDDFISNYFVEEDISYTKDKLTKAIKSIKSGIVYKERFEARVKRKNPEGIIHIELWSDFFENGIIHGITQDITEKKEAEKKIFESEKKYRDIYNAFQDVYYKISIDGTVLEISPSVESIFGYSQKDLLGKGSKLFYDMDVDLEKIQNELIKNREIKDIDISLKSKEEKTVYCSLSAKLIIDEITQLPIGIEGVLRDISDRRKAEMALELSEKKYRDVFNAFPDVYYKVDNNETITEVSPSVSVVGGYLPEDIVGTHVSSFFFSEDDRKGFFIAIQENFEVKDYNIQIRAKDGKIVDCSLNAKIIFDNNKNKIGIEGVLRDISDRRKIELALKESEKKYRDVFNAFIDVYYQLSMDGVILEITPSVEHIGYTRKELIGTPASLLYPKDVDQALLYEKLSVMKQVTDYDIIMLTKDKRKINCAVTARVLHDEKGKPYMIEGVIRNISDRVRIHKTLKQSENELKKSNATKEKILSIIGHDLLGPIGTNKGITDLIVKEKYNLSKDKIVELISSLKPSIDSTYTMVENLLSWARIQRKVIEYNPEPSYLKLLIDECFSLFSYQAKSKSIELNFTGFENLSAYFDENQIIIVLRNLISNAIKFTDIGGKVKVNMEEKNGMAEISVTDTGIGIPKKLLSGLFEDSAKKESRFGTDNERGTGLGLVIVKEFVNINKGEITVESKEGTGTTFTFTLPLIMKLQ